MSEIEYSDELIESLRVSLGQWDSAADESREHVRDHTLALADRTTRAAELRRLLRHVDPERAAMYAERGPDPVTNAGRIAAELRAMAALVETLPVARFGSVQIEVNIRDAVAAAALVDAAHAAWPEAERLEHVGFTDVRAFVWPDASPVHRLLRVSPVAEPEPVTPSDDAVVHAAAAFDEDRGRYTTSCGLDASADEVVDADEATCPACNTAVRAQNARVARTALADDPQHEHEFVLAGVAEDAEPEDCSCGMTYQQYDAGMGERIAEALEARSGATS